MSKGKEESVLLVSFVFRDLGVSTRGSLKSLHFEDYTLFEYIYFLAFVVLPFIRIHAILHYVWYAMVLSLAQIKLFKSKLFNAEIFLIINIR